MNVYLSSFAHALGDRVSIADLPELSGTTMLQGYLDDGLATVRASTSEPWELAAASSKDTLSRHSGEFADSSGVDRVIYATGSLWAPDVAQKAPLQYLEQTGLAQTPLLATGFHGCNNAGPLVESAANAVRSGHPTVLGVTTDVCQPGSRLMVNNLSIMSDGAASFVAGSRQPAQGYRLLGLGIGVEAGMHNLDPATDTMASVKGTVRGLGRATEHAFAAAEVDRSDVAVVLTNNYGPSARQIFCAAAKVDFERTYDKLIADIGHSYAADTFIALERLIEERRLTPGDVVACLWTGLTSWSVGLFEYAEH